MFEESIKQSKPLPDYSGSDNYHVRLALFGEMQDPKLLRFLEKVGTERLATFSTHDFLILDLVHREADIPDEYRSRIAQLVDQGVIERVARGKCVLSRRFYTFVGRKGVYTRKRGLDRETNKALAAEAHPGQPAVTAARSKTYWTFYRP